MTGATQLAIVSFAIAAAFVAGVVVLELVEAWREAREWRRAEAMRRHPAGRHRVIPAVRCAAPPPGWFCALPADHAGPCPTWPEPARGRGGRHARP